LLLVQAPTGNAVQKPERPVTNPCGSVMGVECGHISGNVYHNDYFGLSYAFPDTWKTIPQDVVLSVHQKKVEKERNDALRESHGKPVYLFESWDLLLALKFGPTPLPESKSFNSNIVLWADELSPQVHTLADQFEVSGFTRDPATKILKSPAPVTIAGRQFLRADRLDREDQRDVYHTRIVTFMRSYAIGIDFYSDDLQELEKMVSTLESLRFETQPDTGSVSGRLYRNQFFKFSYQLPDGLTPLDDYMMRQVDLRQRQEHMAELPALPQVTVIFFTSYDLLSAQGAPTSADKKVGPWLRIWAEKGFLTTTPENYFVNNSTFLMDDNIKGRKLPEKLTVGGRTFARAERWGKVQGTKVYEARVATVFNDLTLVFEFGAGSQKELDDLLGSLNSVKFD